MIVTAVDQDQDAGMVAAAVVDPNNNIVSRIGINQDGHWVHAERYAIEEYQRQFGNIPNGTTIVTTLSPCTSDNMELRSGDSCCSLLEELGIKEVYCGYYDPEQAYGYPKYKLIETTNPKIKELCRQIAQRMFDRDKEDLQENLSVTDLNGNSQRIPKAEYDAINKLNDVTLWKYVPVASKESKRRKELNTLP